MPTLPETLVLVPTEYERKILVAVAVRSKSNDGFHAELCGFGPIAAAARTSQLIGIHRPDWVLLAGIAGSYDESIAIGNAYAFRHAACFGIGAGSGEEFESSAHMGWPQWPGDETADETTNAFGDVIELSVPETFQEPDCAGVLLTTTAAAKNASDCARRRKLFPNATCEDMEAFGVAAACRLHGVPVTVVRGISNLAGDRDKSNWAVDLALQSAFELITRFLTD